MIKKTPFIFIVVCNLLFYMLGGNCLADISSDALDAQRDLIISYIEQNKLPEADAAVTDLVADLASVDTSMIDGIVDLVSLAYWDKGEYAKIDDFASVVISRRPDVAMCAHNYKARTAFKRGDYAAVDASCQKLLSEYSHRNSATWTLNEIAYHYQNEGKNDKARALYEEVVKETPAGNSNLLRTHAELAKMDIRDGDFTSANIRCNKLLSDFPEDPLLDENVNRLNKAYLNKGNYTKVRELASAVISKQPNNAMWAYARKAIASYKLGDSADADASCQELAANYDHTNAAWGVREIATYYLRDGEYDKAKQMYETVIGTWPDDLNAILAKADMAAIPIKLGNLELADVKFNQLREELAGHKDLSEAIFLVIEHGYYDSAVEKKLAGDKEGSLDYLERAVSMCQKWVEPFAHEKESLQIQTCLLLALAHHDLGNQLESIENYQKIVGSYPDSEFAGHALFMVGRSLEKRPAEANIVASLDLDSMVTVVEETDVKPISSAREAYRKLLEKYPDSQGAGYARRWLNKRNSN